MQVTREKQARKTPHQSIPSPTKPTFSSYLFVLTRKGPLMLLPSSHFEPKIRERERQREREREEREKEKDRQKRVWCNYCSSLLSQECQNHVPLCLLIEDPKRKERKYGDEVGGHGHGFYASNGRRRRRSLHLWEDQVSCFAQGKAKTALIGGCCSPPIR